MIPKLHYISQGNTPEAHLEHIQNACASGAELVQLRLENIEEPALLKIAEKARDITQHFQTRLIIYNHYKIAKTVKADGVYLAKKNSSPTVVKKHLYSWQSIGSAANTMQDCQTLIAKKVDYIFLGSFRLTPTKNDSNLVLGLNGYLTILDELKTEIPIIAIGGITLTDVPELLKIGVYGIALSDELTKDFNKIKSFKQLLQSSELQEQIWTPDQQDPK